MKIIQQIIILNKRVLAGSCRNKEEALFQAHVASKFAFIFTVLKITGPLHLQKITSYLKHGHQLGVHQDSLYTRVNYDS
jgi:hypothetical protein